MGGSSGRWPTVGGSCSQLLRLFGSLSGTFGVQFCQPSGSICLGLSLEKSLLLRLVGVDAFVVGTVLVRSFTVL